MIENPEELRDEDFISAAKLLGCDATIIKAFASVESSGCGFWNFDDGWKPKLKFEAHWFGYFTQYIYNESHPTISSKGIVPSLNTRGPGEYRRLDEACALNRAAGLKSSSWGKFQIMGFNYGRSGFSELQDFINAMFRSESDQLKAFCNFIKSDYRLLAALKNHDYQTMALLYNGKTQVMSYSAKLEQAYWRLS